MPNETKPSGLPDWLTRTDYEIWYERDSWLTYWMRGADKDAMIAEAKILEAAGYGRSVVIEATKRPIFDTADPA